ncbi:zinc metalloprotease [Thermococcus thioreducens]|uniref:Archaemetzincin n=1 Tax=Thermococcus thioreducens TaxID=277988 RepID=A0A0Q2MRS5_9EURY|nr:peptidase M54 [Thermococcus thioreducens]ASJ12596.1 peptidase M54 [Thermococcus thioreducens]KQH82407.1 peptidase M54 [Thermococcus thioreducens]SEV88140.1 archaemetzincin [Thermococcus thioreducens]
MEFIAFTYVGNFMEREVIDEVVFTVFDEANRFFRENDISLRFLYIGKLKLEPGYLISLNTPEGKMRVYPLEALVDVLHARLLHEIEERPDIRMDKIFALTTFPLVSRNPYFDFYERFLGIHETRLGLRIMVLSMKPFEPPELGELLKAASGSETPDEEIKRRVRGGLSLFKDRVLKGVLHEVGHGFGLEHCSNDCVMNSPSTMEEWDSRMLGYCDSCFINLKRAVEWSEFNLGHGEPK